MLPFLTFIVSSNHYLLCNIFNPLIRYIERKSQELDDATELQKSRSATIPIFGVDDDNDDEDHSLALSPIGHAKTRTTFVSSPVARLNFYDKIRKNQLVEHRHMYRSRSAPNFAPAEREAIELEGNEFTPRSAYITKCAEAHLVPKFVGDSNGFDVNSGILDCASFGIGDNYILALAQAALHFPHLCVLKLSSNNLADVTAAQIIEQLNAKGTPVMQLDFSNNKVSQRTAVELSRLMRNPKCSLRDLNLEHNLMKDVPTAQLHAGLLHEHCKLRRLNLGHNDIKCLGAEALSDALLSNSTLITLTLGWNMIRSRGASRIFDCYKKNKTLQSLGIN